MLGSAIALSSRFYGGVYTHAKGSEDVAGINHDHLQSATLLLDVRLVVAVVCLRSDVSEASSALEWEGAVGCVGLVCEEVISLRGVPIDSPVALVDTVQIDVWTTAATRVRCSLAPMLKDGVDTSLSKCRDAAVLGEVVWVAFVAVVVVVG